MSKGDEQYEISEKQEITQRKQRKLSNKMNRKKIVRKELRVFLVETSVICLDIELHLLTSSLCLNNSAQCRASPLLQLMLAVLWPSHTDSAYCAVHILGVGPVLS
jgi:hypothetical protein